MHIFVVSIHYEHRVFLSEPILRNLLSFNRAYTLSCCNFHVALFYVDLSRYLSMSSAPDTLIPRISKVDLVCVSSQATIKTSDRHSNSWTMQCNAVYRIIQTQCALQSQLLGSLVCFGCELSVCYLVLRMAHKVVFPHSFPDLLITISTTVANTYDQIKIQIKITDSLTFALQHN